jgi:hypothetical protein
MRRVLVYVAVLCADVAVVCVWPVVVRVQGIIMRSGVSDDVPRDVRRAVVW